MMSGGPRIYVCTVFMCASNTALDARHENDVDVVERSSGVDLVGTLSLVELSS